MIPLTVPGQRPMDYFIIDLYIRYMRRGWMWIIPEFTWKLKVFNSFKLLYVMRCRATHHIQKLYSLALQIVRNRFMISERQHVRTERVNKHTCFTKFWKKSESSSHDIWWFMLCGRGIIWSVFDRAQASAKGSQSSGDRERSRHRTWSAARV